MEEDIIISQLKSSILNSHKNKSSYWKKHTKNQNFEDVYNILSSGAFSKNEFKRNID